MTIFRSEVVDRQRPRLDGDVSLALPLSWQFLGVFLFCVVVAAIAFVLAGSYTRVETVAGVVEPTGGLARVVPPVSGTVDELFVDTGDAVTKGSSLAVVRTGMTLAEGVVNSEAQEQILVREELGLARQETEISASARSRSNEIDRMIADRQAAVRSLDRQIAIQKKILQAARVDLDRAREVAARGFISKQDLDLRLKTYYSLEQELLRLQRDLDQNRNGIGELLESKSTARSETGARLAALASQKSSLAQRSTQSRLQEAYRLTSPVDGSVAVIAARRSDHVSSGEPLMIILPDRSALIAKLKVPSTAIGFLKKGQNVKLAIDAFPYQHFGTVPGHVDSIAGAPIASEGSRDSEQSFYRVTVVLDRDWIAASGERRPLVAGMKCSATIVTDKRALIDWLLEPLFSARTT
jgi:membrane fusion protein